jgi:transposase-like protein
LEKCARRRLDEPYPYLILDARYEKVREDGAVRVTKTAVPEV